MTILAGAKASAVDLTLPIPAQAYANGVNTIVSAANTWADLPTIACAVSITNPHPTAPMLCLVTWSAWLSVTTSSEVRVAPRVSGSTTITAGPGGIAYGWGQIPRADTTTGYGSKGGSGYVQLPASVTAATFTLQAFRVAATGTQQVNYSVMEICPLRFVF